VSRIALLICLAASAARAEVNDIQLWRLGHPSPLGCTRCDGSGGDPPEAADAGAQARFHRFATTLGLAFAPPFLETAGTVGQAGFEVGVSSSQALLRIANDAWPTAGTQGTGAPPGVLVLPALTVRKGLGGSVELGAAVSWLVNSQMMAISAELRWALLDGLAWAPDLALRAWGTRVIGTQDLDLASAGADAQLSRSFGVAGMIKLQPYLQGGIAMVNAMSGVVDFKPGVENPASPIADDGVFKTVNMLKNRYLRGAVGLRMVAGAVVLGVEGAFAEGRNPIQDGPPGTAENFVRLTSFSGRLGFTF
jgi:hypothetical protein